MIKNRNTHVIVVMLYDFIEGGALACQNTLEAVKATIKYINEHPDDKVLYVCDSHPENHCSFKENGGLWAGHCVPGTKGAEIHEDFFTGILEPQNRPNERNIFRKGLNPRKEQYSGYAAQNEDVSLMFEDCTKNVFLSGIATEYCVKKTAFDLLRDGFNVTLIKDNLGFFEEKSHLKGLQEMQEQGVKVI